MPRRGRSARDHNAPKPQRDQTIKSNFIPANKVHQFPEALPGICKTIFNCAGYFSDAFFSFLAIQKSLFFFSIIDL